METITQTPATPKGKQDFTVGNTVRIGGSLYRVVGHKPPPAKGEAAIVELVSHDLERRYEWQPFRGLRVIGDKPKRIRKRKPKAKHAQAAAPQAVQKTSFWTRLLRVVKRH